MPYYHNQRVYGRNQSPCQTPPSRCASQPSCPDERTVTAPPCASRQAKDSCGGDTNSCCSLAVANVVMQKSDSPTFDAENALIIGTIYKELDKPFLGEGGCKR